MHLTTITERGRLVRVVASPGPFPADQRARLERAGFAVEEAAIARTQEDAVKVADSLLQRGLFG